MERGCFAVLPGRTGSQMVVAEGAGKVRAEAYKVRIMGGGEGRPAAGAPAVRTEALEVRTSGLNG